MNRQDAATANDSALRVFWVFLRLGCTSFGGPVAHLGYFREAFVARRRWLSEAAYADLVAFCQFLPGPASSQVGMAVGHARAGVAGALAAWVGFTLPSAALLIALALGLTHLAGEDLGGALHGLKLVAVAVVAHAVWGMAEKLCTERRRITLAVACAALVLIWPRAGVQVAAMVAAGLLGRLLFADEHPHSPAEPAPAPAAGRLGPVLLVLFAVLLVGLPLAAHLHADPVLDLVDAFYRTGSLVFGGGHVVLPLLREEVVTTGLVGQETFLAGYGAAQAVPGPLFSFTAFLGAAMDEPGGWWGGLLCLSAVYLPSFLLVLGALPFYQRVRTRPGVRAALSGVNAGVVGLLAAALYTPVWTSAVLGPIDVALGLIYLVLLRTWRLPSWLVVLLGGLLGALLG